MEIFLFTLVGVRSKPARKSCQYCNTELHPGKSFQIPEGLDSSPFYNQLWYCPWFQQRQNQDGDCFKYTRTILQVVHCLHPILCVARSKDTSHTYSSWTVHIFLSWGSSEVHSLHMCKQPIQAFLKVEKRVYESCPWSKFHARPQIQVLLESCFLLIFWKNTGFSSSVELCTH